MQKCSSLDFGLSARVQLEEYLVVFSEMVVDIPDQVFAVPIYLVVESVSAIITAEFLVAPSFEGFSAFQTFSFFHAFHFF